MSFVSGPDESDPEAPESGWAEAGKSVASGWLGSETTRSTVWSLLDSTVGSGIDEREIASALPVGLCDCAAYFEAASGSALTFSSGVFGGVVGVLGGVVIASDSSGTLFSRPGACVCVLETFDSSIGLEELLRELGEAELAALAALAATARDDGRWVVIIGVGFEGVVLGCVEASSDEREPVLERGVDFDADERGLVGVLLPVVLLGRLAPPALVERRFTAAGVGLVAVLVRELLNVLAVDRTFGVGDGSSAAYLLPIKPPVAGLGVLVAVRELVLAPGRLPSSAVARALAAVRKGVEVDGVAARAVAFRAEDAVAPVALEAGLGAVVVALEAGLAAASTVLFGRGAAGALFLSRTESVDVLPALGADMVARGCSGRRARGADQLDSCSQMLDVW